MSDTIERVVGSEIADWDDREYEEIPVKVWKAKARVQTLNAKELTDLIEVGGTGIGYRLVALCLVDPAGRQVFRAKDAPFLTPKDAVAMDAAVERVMLKNPKAIAELSDALIKANGITLKTADAVTQADDLKKNSEATPTDALPTDSPSS